MRIKNITDHNNSFPWVLLQKWEHLLFLHYSIPAEALQAYIPKGLVLDTFNGKAWISIVSFEVSWNRLRYLPKMPYIEPMLQINARTYVKRQGKSGVYFFSMDTNKFFTVLGGKVIKAPFLHADVSMSKSANTYHISSSRKGKQTAKFQASYTPMKELFYPEKQSLDYWLLERYIFWSYRKGHLYRGDILHESWNIRKAEAHIENQSLFFFLPEKIIGENPIVHYASSKVAFNSMIKKIE